MPKGKPPKKPFKKGNQLAKPYWFQKGHSGNPNGSRRQRLMREYIAEAVNTPLPKNLRDKLEQRIGLKLSHEEELTVGAALAARCVLEALGSNKPSIAIARLGQILSTEPSRHQVEAEIEGVSFAALADRLARLFASGAGTADHQHTNGAGANGSGAGGG